MTQGSGYQTLTAMPMDDEAQALPSGAAGQGLPSRASAASDPQAASQGQSYWKGDFRAQPQGEDPYRPPSYGAAADRMRQAYAAQALRQKDHIVAGLLAIFLGMFGVHKFYLGYNQAGFIMLAVTVIGGLFTFGLAGAVMGILAVVEGVLYLVRSQTDFDQAYVIGQRDWF